MKWIKYIGIMIILCNLVYAFSFFQKEQVKKEMNQKLISEFENKQTIDESILGTIEIEKNHIKNLIVKGKTEQVINKNQVAILYSSTLNVNENIYLAGHSIPEVFGSFHESTVGDKIVLNIESKKYTYLIDKKEYIKTDNFKILNESSDTPRLILITCTKDTNKRLLVFAHLTII